MDSAEVDTSNGIFLVIDKVHVARYPLSVQVHLVACSVAQFVLKTAEQSGLFWSFDRVFECTVASILEWQTNGHRAP